MIINQLKGIYTNVYLKTNQISKIILNILVY